MTARKALQIFVLTALCASRALGADVAPTCQTGPLAIQIDQLFEKRESYDVGGRAYVPFARQWGGIRSVTIIQRTHGQQQLIVPMAQEGLTLRGAGVMTMKADQHIRARTQSCIRTRIFVVNWTLQGAVSDQCTIELTIVRDWTEQTTEPPCSVDLFGQFAGGYPPISETWQASLKAEHGASTKREVGNFAAKDFSTLTVIRTAQ
jgi:hypothetical protein